MATPKQMFDNRLNALKGWPSQYALDKSLEIADGETGILAGKIIHVDPTTKKFKLGLPGNYMPIYCWAAQTDFDAMGGDDGNISLAGNKKGTSGLVATGSYELQTTEFVSGSTYLPNTPLTVDDGAGDIADKGSVKPGTFYTDVIAGIVSDGQTDQDDVVNAHGKAIVTFWSYFLPATA